MKKMTASKGRINLKGKSREEKLQLIDAAEEARRRAVERRDEYTANPGQLRVHASEAAERYVFAGNGAGKTTMLTQEVLWAATGYNPITKQTTKVPSKSILVLDAPEKVAGKQIPELKKWFPLKPEQLHKDGKPYHVRITFENGSEVLIMFHDQDPMKFESIDDIDYLFYDEPPPRHIYIALKRGTRGKNSRPKTLLVGTPLAAPWLRTEVYEPWSKGLRKGTECFKFSTHVNEANLREGFIEEFSEVLSEQERRIRLHGDFFDLSGLALAHLLDRERHFVAPFKWPETWPVVLAIDPHPRKAHVAILLGIDPHDQLFVIKEHSSKCAPSVFADEVATLCFGYKVVNGICDSLGSSDLTGGMGTLSFIQVMNRKWEEDSIALRIRPTTFDEKRDEAWIQRIQECLLLPIEEDQFGNINPELRFFTTCKGTIFDVENVAWQKIRLSEEVKPKLDMTKKDFLSCLKYALASQPSHKSTKARYHVTGRSPWSGSAGQGRFSDNRMRYNRRRIEAASDDDDF